MRKFMNILKVFVALIIFGVSIVLAINLYVLESVKTKIISLYDAKNLSNVDCVLVLGAGLKNGGPSDMLQERLDMGISLYKENNDLILLMSGDHHRKDYDEVNVMKRYASLNDVPTSKVFMDHAGLSTYDSLKRAKDVFGVKKIVIVTQKYHLSRALYIADSLGIEAYGVDATKKDYPGQSYRNFREILARNKDFLKSIIRPDASIVGDKISLDGDGNKTNDKYVIITNLNSNEETFSGSSVLVNNVLNLVNTNNYTEETCDGIPKYLMEINGDKYYIEMYDASVHIRIKSKELVLNKSDAEVILNLIR